MRKINYDLYPEVKIEGFQYETEVGYKNISLGIKNKVSTIDKKIITIVVETYPGVNEEEILINVTKYLNPSLVIKSNEANLSFSDVNDLIKRDLTEDRVRGFMNNYNMEEFFDSKKLDELKNRIDKVDSGVVLILGTGASLIKKADMLIYCDLSRWEIQLRYRREEIANWCADNYAEDFLTMYKRAYFVDWRVADRFKQKLFKDIDFLMDTNKTMEPKMISGTTYKKALEIATSKPFRTVPYFDSGLWGGQWMKETCGLDKESPNYAWCFDGVPEENSLLLNFGETTIEIPSINLVLFQSEKLLGEKVISRFGKEFPIRFDFLDTMEGGNLSLQVHPTTDFIKKQYGMSYTQDESYYILDAQDDATVYLGTKTGVDSKQMIKELNDAQGGGEAFDTEKFINKIPAKKHDHFLIPAGTVHCSGKNAMVLEISATPYIFTFKLWDWGRVGMDGKPRPIHIEEGAQVINYNFDTEAIYKNHVNNITTITEHSEWREERTGLHELEFIETRRHWFSGKVPHNTKGTVNVLNLIQGEEAIIESPTGAFEPFIVHYAETFIIPASVGEYTISPYGDAAGRECATMKAYVRNSENSDLGDN
ncbi:MAG: class I mannose-6-phosphate isomerase [Spirochaetaceae bacterium]